MKPFKLLRAISLTYLTYIFYIHITSGATIGTWRIFTGTLGFNALLYYIETFRKEK